LIVNADHVIFWRSSSVRANGRKKEQRIQESFVMSPETRYLREEVIPTRAFGTASVNWATRLIPEVPSGFSGIFHVSDHNCDVHTERMSRFGQPRYEYSDILRNVCCGRDLAMDPAKGTEKALQLAGGATIKQDSNVYSIKTFSEAWGVIRARRICAHWVLRCVLEVGRPLSKRQPFSSPARFNPAQATATNNGARTTPRPFKKFTIESPIETSPLLRFGVFPFLQYS
jgi:hypothetical protein